MHEFYQSYQSSPAGLKILEFGAGPNICFQISTALYASEIVLLEYTQKNREVLQMWLDQDPKALNWKPFLSVLFRSWRKKVKKRLH